MVSLDSVHIVYLQAYRAAKPLKPPPPQTTNFFGWLISYPLSHFLFLFVGAGSIQSKVVISDLKSMASQGYKTAQITPVSPLICKMLPYPTNTVSNK